MSFDDAMARSSDVVAPSQRLMVGWSDMASALTGKQLARGGHVIRDRGLLIGG